MHLILLRHGKAEPDAPSGRDADRLLRPKGEEQAKFVGQALAARTPPPRRIISSGIVRAVQTARIVQGVLGCTLRIEPALETGAAASAVVDLIDRERRGGEGWPEGGLVVVGHNPTLEDVAGVLIGGIGARPVPLRTGEALVLEASGAPADLVGAWTLVEAIRLEHD